MSPVAIAQTRQFLDAPVVKSQLRVRWNASLKSMQWAADNDATFRAFPPNALFLTKRSIYVVYRRLNPLSTQATVTTSAVADPAYTNIITLLNALTSVANTVVPGLPSGTATPANQAPPPPPPRVVIAAAEICPDPASDIANFRADVDADSPANVAKIVLGWPGTIDAAFTTGLSGPQSIGAGVKAINDFGATLGTHLNDAKKHWGVITGCATTATDATKRAIYQAVSLYDPNPRMQQITALKTTVTSLADSLLKQFGASEQWTGPNSTDYVISAEVVPTFAVMQNLTTKVVNLTLKVDDTTSALSTEQQAAGSTTFSVREYSTLTTEIGVGAVFGSIKQPTYGTSTNAAGQMIVAKKADTAPSVNGAVLANFVCRCGTGLLVPMVQVGALASKDLPSILVGGGLRLFGLGKGDIAIGGGAMASWYKDLNKLKVGDVVTGTNDINSDLKFISRPKIGGYVTIQYKF